MKKTSGFTLIEIAMTLVIIGLVVGGIAAGSSLMRSAQINQLIIDAKNYEGAIRLFDEEYAALPGDFDEAEDYWGVGITDNGNDDGKILGGENKYVFQHLSLAQILPDDFDPTSTDLTNIFPGAGISDKSIWSFLYFPASLYGVIRNHIFFIISVGGGDVITAAEAKKIDMKIDDGAPNTGKFLTVRLGAATNCVTQPYTVSETTLVKYILNNDGANCTPVWVYD